MKSPLDRAAFYEQASIVRSDIQWSKFASAVHARRHFACKKTALGQTQYGFAETCQERFEVMELAKNDVFLSYTKGDEAIAAELFDKLTELGLKCFIASGDIHPGEEWLKKLHAALDQSRSIVILVTPRSLASKWVHIEIGAAWMKQIPIFPVLQFIEPEQLSAIAAEFQCTKIETDCEKQLFIDSICKRLNLEKKLRMSFDFMKEKVEKAHEDMVADGVTPTVVVGSGKGGALCAAAFATKFNCRLKVIDCDFLGDKPVRKTVIDSACLSRKDIGGRNVLVVEWARKTGGTFNQIAAALKKVNCEHIISYALFWTEESARPQYFGKTCRIGEVPLGPLGEH